MSTIFYNWSNEPFKYSWDSDSFLFAPGQLCEDVIKSESGKVVVLEKGIAQHFAYHLAVREGDRENLATGMPLDAFIAKALTVPEKEPEIQAELSPEIVATIEEVEAAEEPKKKRGRPAKIEESEEVIA